MSLDRLTKLFAAKQQGILNIYTTAGYPQLDSTVEVVLELEKSGADLIELGMPYSDPLADGETIQGSSSVALKNGINLELIFEQVKSIRATSEVPIILMGYFNQMLQYGSEKFLNTCQTTGVDGLIIPDLPMDIYEHEYKSLFERYKLGISFLVTPQTSKERILKADTLSSAFLYVVSQSSITGSSADISTEQVKYFDALEALNLSSPRLIGFGIHDKKTFETACLHGHGAIVGSAFIRALKKEGKLPEIISNFVSSLKG